MLAGMLMVFDNSRVIKNIETLSDVFFIVEISDSFTTYKHTELSLPCAHLSVFVSNRKIIMVLLCWRWTIERYDEALVFPF